MAEDFHQHEPLGALEQLQALARAAELESRAPGGRFIDGAPYTCYDTPGSAVGKFLRAAEKWFGGYDKLQAMVEERRRNGETKADPNCGNWILWTLFLKLGVDCEQPSK